MDDFKQKSKRVRRLESGVYTIQPESVRQRDDHLCNICSIKSNCPVQRALSIAESHAKATISTCARFVPSLGFRKPYDGLGFDLFNTLRVGTTWVERLTVGKIIALTDSSTNEILRFGKVDRVSSGSLDKMLEIHAQFNHIAMAGKGVAEVEKVIRKSYGHFLTKDSKLTAIYIKKVNHAIIDAIDKKFGDTPDLTEVNVESSLDRGDNVVSLDWHRGKSK